MKSYCEFCDHANLCGDEYKCTLHGVTQSPYCRDYSIEQYLQINKEAPKEETEECEIVTPAFCNNVDINVCSEDELAERISYLKSHLDVSSRSELEALGTMILTGYPF